jgi:hypothetical protein
MLDIRLVVIIRGIRCGWNVAAELRAAACFRFIPEHQQGGRLTSAVKMRNGTDRFLSYLKDAKSSDRLSLISNRPIATWRLLGHLVLLDLCGGWACLRAHFPFAARTVTVQLMLILCGDCMEIFWPDRLTVPVRKE